MFGKSRSETPCAAIESKLIAYLDGRARPDERHAVESHLKTCDGCRARVEGFNAVWNALDDLPEISPSPAFDASLRARIAAEPAPRRFWDWLPSPRLAFAVTALAVLSIWLGSVPRHQSNPTVVASQAPASQVAPDAAESDFRMIRDLPVLENYDVVSKFDALSELPGPAASSSPSEGARETR